MTKNKTAGWADSAGKSMGKGLLEGIREKISPLLEEQIRPFWSQLHKEFPETARSTVRAAAEEAKNIGSKAVKSVTVPAAIGAATGAAAAPSGERGEGAVRGAVGGLAGGLVGAAWGRGHSSVVNRAATLGGSLLGGAAGGATMERSSQEKKPMKNKYAGVTLDWYDDKGATLKMKFPTLDSLPDVIKEANVQPFEKLSHEDFALVALDEGHVMCKFACHDPGTTAMSVIYFMEHGDKLPSGAQKLAAANLVEACRRFNLRPPVELSHAAEKSASVIDITGQRPRPKIKTAAPKSADDYAVVVNGKGYYPIHTWDLVKKAEAYFQDEKGRMQPEIRRQYAVKLASKAEAMGYPLDPEITDIGATDWASKGHLRAAVEMRKVACQPGEDRQFLDELFEKRASLEPDVYAEVLRRFDVARGLDRVWDRVILDPWSSTFGMNKSAAVVWEDGADRVTDDQLMHLAQNHAAWNKDFTEDFRKEFVKDPVSIFESLPLPQKRIIARLASDLPYQSEMTQAVVG